MRIAYITADPGVPVFGQKGCSIHVQEVLNALSKRGARIELFATNCVGAPAESDPARSGRREEGPATSNLTGVQLRPLSRPPKGALAHREQKCLAANDELRASLQAYGPFDLIYERHSLWSYAGMEHARAAGVPGLLEVNAPLIEEQAQHRGLVDRDGAQAVAERVYGAATALLAVSEEVARYLEGFPAARGKVHIVANGVNPERFQKHVGDSRFRTTGTFTIGFVGTMKPWHGVGNLVEAFARLHQKLPKARLLLVGDGISRQQLEAEVATRGLGNAVEFTGAVRPEEVPALLASMDVAVAPYPKSDRFYFSPLKVYEYMAAGLPVVASRVGQLEQLIENDATGVLVPPGDVPALTSGLERLWRDSGLRARLGSAARAKVARNHTWDQAVEHILRIAGLEYAI